MEAAQCFVHKEKSDHSPGGSSMAGLYMAGAGVGCCFGAVVSSGPEACAAPALISLLKYNSRPRKLRIMSQSQGNSKATQATKTVSIPKPD